MSASHEGQGESRSEKWILWNMDQLGRSYVSKGNKMVPIQEHWIYRFRTEVWWIGLRCLFFFMKKERANEPTPLQCWFFYAMASALSLIPAMIVVAAFSWPGLLLLAWNFIIALATNPIGYWTVFVGLLVGGGIAYYLRRNLRSFYGGAELVFAVCLIRYGLIESLRDDPNLLRVFLGVIGGIYVIVRGLDNIVQGWAEAALVIKELRRRPTRQEIDF